MCVTLVHNDHQKDLDVLPPVSVLSTVISYPYPPTTYPADGSYSPNLAYGSALLLTMGTPASSFQSDKVGSYVISGETINGAPVWRHTASDNKLYADACKTILSN